MITNREWLMMSIFDCGCDDLSLLDDFQYDTSEVLEEIGFPDIEMSQFNLNTVLEGIFRIGFRIMKSSIREQINDLKSVSEVRELDEEESELLERLSELNVDEDFYVYYNFLDTHVNCNKHVDTYRNWIEEVISEFEYGTGFNVEGL